MDGVWLISYVALWCLTLVLAAVVLVQSRLLGLLHHRFGPAGARPLADGPELGSRLDQIRGRRLDGSPWTWTLPSRQDLILVFVSPQCQACNELVPHLKDFVRTRRDPPVTIVSTLSDDAMNSSYVAYQRMERLEYVVGVELAERLDIEATPYAIRIDGDGVVVAKGIVNNYENLLGLSSERLGPGVEAVDLPSSGEPATPIRSTS